MVSPTQNHHPQLNTFPTSASARAAIVYQHHAEGCSLIPLIGGDDPNTGKRPVLPWKPYQTQRPAFADIQQWLDEDLSAYGVVCGQISGLIVLDIDDSDVATYLARRFPRLMDTYTVRSGLRGTPHIYWRVDFPVKSQHVLGGDLKAEGSYVVGAGSEIAGQVWQVENDRPIRSISQPELEEVLTGLRPQGNHVSSFKEEGINSDESIKTTPPPHQPNVGGGSHLHLSTIIPDSIVSFTYADVTAIYRAKVEETQQRNVSLFNVACLLRDAGYTKDWTLDALAKLHANESPRLDQKQESYPRRLREAIATINSAYRRPPRPTPPVFAENGSQTQTTSRLPGTIREALLARPERDGTAILRTLEGLYLLGQRPGTAISVPEACRVLKGYVGRHSILKAFAATTETGEPLFDALSDTSVRFCPPNIRAVFLCCSEPLGDGQSEPSQEVYQSTLVGGSRGNYRPAQRFRIPSPEDLCRKLNVAPSTGDPITLDDIVSAKAYREALERGFIKRRPGCYAQSMLADRLHVSDRTVRRYHQASPIQSRACYIDQYIGWFNLSCVPVRAETEEFGRGDSHLIDETGKCYPAYREIAQKLLGKGKKVMYRTRTFNFYWCGDTEPVAAEAKLVENGYEKQGQPELATPLPIAPVALSDEHEVLPAKLDRPPLSPVIVNAEIAAPKLDHPAPTINVLVAKDNQLASEIIYVKPYTLPQVTTTTPRQRRRRTRQFRYPLDDAYAEKIANRVYDSIQDMSLYNARRLVETYGAGVVKAALERVMWLDERRRATNPAGYLVTVIGQIWREYHGWGAPKPAFKAEPKRRSRRRSYDMSKDPITKSEAWLRWSVWFWYEIGDMDRVARWQARLVALGFEAEMVSDWRDGEEAEIGF